MCDLDFGDQGQCLMSNMHILVNASTLKPLDATTSNFAGAFRGYLAFRVTLIVKVNVHLMHFLASASTSKPTDIANSNFVSAKVT